MNWFYLYIAMGLIHFFLIWKGWKKWVGESPRRGVLWLLLLVIAYIPVLGTVMVIDCHLPEKFRDRWDKIMERIFG